MNATYALVLEMSSTAFHPNGDGFGGSDFRPELARVLRELADKVEAGRDVNCAIWDSNEYRIGDALMQAGTPKEDRVTALARLVR